MLRRISFIACIFVMSACSSESRQMIGIERPLPDEFKVMARAPLSIPPNFELRAPQPGAARPQEITGQDQAKQSLLGEKAAANLSAAENYAPASNSTNETSPGTGALLNKAGVAQSDGDIRRTIDREFQQAVEEDQHFLDSLVFWQAKEAPASTVDAAAEAKRLQENKEKGLTSTAGETPTISRRKKGLLEGVF
ncbi:MAG: DUF3035 domain-containing protein [Dongiaceae bacterium]